MTLTPEIFSWMFALLRSRGASLFVFATKILGAGSALVLNVVIARTLGIENAGLFFLNISIVTIAYAIARFGFGYTTYRYIAEANETGRSNEVASIAGFSVLIVLTISIVTAATLTIFADYISQKMFKSPSMAMPLRVMSMTIPIYCVGGMYSEVLKGLRQPLKYSLFESVIIKAASIPLVLWLGTQFSLSGAAWAFVIANIIALCFVVLFGQRAISGASVKRQNFTEKRGMLRSAGYFASVSYFTVASQWVSPLIVGALLNPSSAAIFVTAYRTVVVLDFVLLSIAAVAAPLFVKAFAESGYVGLFSAAKGQVYQAMAISGTLAIMMFAAAPFIMNIYGPEFDLGISALRIMIALQAIATPLGVFGLAVSAAKGEKAMALITPIACLIGLFCAYLGAWFWGLNGAALGTIVSSLMTNIFLTLWFFRLWRRNSSVN